MFNFWEPGITFGLGILVMAIFVIWTIFWKGLALWKSARLGHKWWFVVFLVINTLGILEILYIYIWSKKNHKQHHPNDDTSSRHIAEGTTSA